MRIFVCIALSSAFLFAPMLAEAQVRFEKGYVIDSAGNQLDCLIKNVDWNRNPDKIYYKLTTDSPVLEGDVSTIKEFKVDGYERHVSSAVKIDRSSTVLSSLTVSRHPQWSQEKLFLKVLVEGRAVLYQYFSSNLRRFFYSVNEKPIEQLVSKNT